MRAAGVTEFGGPEALHLVEVPEEHAGPGQVRLRVTAATVNPTDTYLVLGVYAERDPVNHPPSTRALRYFRLPISAQTRTTPSSSTAFRTIS